MIEGPLDQLTADLIELRPAATRRQFADIHAELAAEALAVGLLTTAQRHAWFWVGYERAGRSSA